MGPWQSGPHWGDLSFSRFSIRLYRTLLIGSVDTLAQPMAFPVVGYAGEPAAARANATTLATWAGCSNSSRQRHMAGMLVEVEVEVEVSMLSSMCLKATSALRGAYTNKKVCHPSVCIVNLLRLSASAHQRGTALRQCGSKHPRCAWKVDDSVTTVHPER